MKATAVPLRVKPRVILISLLMPGMDNTFRNRCSIVGTLDKSLLEFNNLLSPANLRVKRLPLTPGNGSPLRFSHWIVFLTRFRFPRIQETILARARFGRPNLSLDGVCSEPSKRLEGVETLQPTVS